jgi:hypothetical protein
LIFICNISNVNIISKRTGEFMGSRKKVGSAKKAVTKKKQSSKKVTTARKKVSSKKKASKKAAAEKPPTLAELKEKFAALKTSEAEVSNLWRSVVAPTLCGVDENKNLLDVRKEAAQVILLGSKLQLITNDLAALAATISGMEGK